MFIDFSDVCFEQLQLARRLAWRFMSHFVGRPEKQLPSIFIPWSQALNLPNQSSRKHQSVDLAVKWPHGDHKRSWFSIYERTVRMPENYTFINKWLSLHYEGIVKANCIICQNVRLQPIILSPPYPGLDQKVFLELARIILHRRNLPILLKSWFSMSLLCLHCVFIHYVFTMSELISNDIGIHYLSIFVISHALSTLFLIVHSSGTSVSCVRACRPGNTIVTNQQSTTV